MVGVNSPRGPDHGLPLTIGRWRPAVQLHQSPLGCFMSCLPSS